MAARETGAVRPASDEALGMGAVMETDRGTDRVTGWGKQRKGTFKRKGELKLELERPSPRSALNPRAGCAA